MEEAKESQKDFDKNLKIVWKGNKNDEQEKTFLMEEMKQLISSMAMVQWFLKLKNWLMKSKNNKMEQVLNY